MKKSKRRIMKWLSSILCMIMVLTILPAIPASAATSLRGESIYQIMVDRFYDGDPTNNATGEAFRYTEDTQDDFRYMHGGDWQGIIDKIPYIKGMGYTAIWISPVSDPQLWGIPDPNGTQWPTAYHGYNVYDPNRANRYFGTEDAQESKEKLKELVDTCHENGIKVILDVVPNHVGDYLQGIGDSAQYLTNASGLKAGTQLQPVAPFNNVQWYHNLGDINWDLEHPHTAESTQMLEDHDLGGLDDIDLDNEDAKDAIYDSIKGWFTYTGADAARVDAAKCMNPSDIHELQEYLGVATFGENFDMDVSFVKDWVGDNAETGMLDFPLFQAIVNDFAYGQNFNNTSELSIQAVLDQDWMYGDYLNDMVTFIDNHDRNRFLTEAGGDADKLHNALTFIYTARGIPVVFQGTEQNRGNANGQIISGIADTWNRWSMQTKDANGNVTKDYFDTSTDTYQLIADLNGLRSQYEALADGTQREMWTSMHTYAFSRRVDSGENEGQELICAFHNAEGTESTTMSIRAESSITPGTTLVNVFNPNDKITVSSDNKITITLTGNSSKIYVVDEDADPLIPVTFTINNATTNWGENVYIAGNCEELGNWDPEKAVGPAVCPDYPIWNLTAYLPAGTNIEFKAIKKDASENITWQDGDNRTYSVPTSGTGRVTINW
ncbi:alpha-amylase family glycosyl hydrolase [[Clostridium] scindens]|uniref:alpha-amylase family glycosyl hydrolase n=1 Tax=Clostridium scindens (strain JCM 10418 / VPI 12708) TaxID=29347 RepID=UPI00298C35AA|nr:alpha-amylase family glycosyl hydrolase [[Clostridium] scindens]WPB39401.1 Cyclomaltodextrin glucanotransferase [[Clostridium] scindens]